MNKIITTHVMYRGKVKPVSELAEQSNITVVVECPHGQRKTRWCRRYNLCPKCCLDKGVYNTSPKGRKIGWGDKISKAKKGKKFSEEHKKALVDVRKKKICKRLGISLEEFKEFPSYSIGRFNIYLLVRAAIIYHWDISKVPFSKNEIEIFKMLGWNLLDFKNHMESKFGDEYSWSTYGYRGWHIDHVKPLSWFKIDSIYDDSFKECWRLSNLQPLWAEDNYKKNNLYCG